MDGMKFLNLLASRITSYNVCYTKLLRPTSIATSSMTATLAEGKTLDEAMHLTEDDIAMALDGLPEDKMHCSNLGITALKNAINNYYKGKI